ncbi:MAG: hypothetical protein GWO24_21375 [Akkermansiaceae bacterium]|nr:hypothetical protein [Akkermansiaceae bacterium]NIT76233.1 hypothetical protein [Thermoplasmata archaeon]NIY02604.1 hypothetical protein [Thermoplasmata archaeon]
MIAPTPDILTYRYELHAKLANDPDGQALARARWADDCAAWVRECLWTFDPRESPAFLPFAPFPRQQEYLDWITERFDNAEQGIAEKTRDMGLTYCACAWALHRWLYFDGFKATFVSRKLELVDRIGDMDTIFEKLRFMRGKIPEYLLPRGFDPRVHDGRGKLINPENGSSITGEGGANAGRGGRSSIYFIDEAAYLDHPDKVEPAISANSDCRIYISTPNGPDRLFYSKRHSGKFSVFTFHWRDDPRKSEDWYTRKKDEMDPVDFAREVEIDYSESQEDTLIPMRWVRAAVGLDLPPGPEIVCGLDVAELGSSKNAIAVCRSPVVVSLDRWSGMNTTQTAHRAKEITEGVRASQLRFDATGIGAGVRGTLESLEEDPTFEVVPIYAGASPSPVYYDNKAAKDKFTNLRAEMWWELRRRFQRTWEHVEGGVKHDPSDMISIPNRENLIQQLTQPKFRFTEGGKIRLESKDQMRTRGISSPDEGDALAMGMTSAFSGWGSADVAFGGEVSGGGADRLTAGGDFW